MKLVKVVSQQFQLVNGSELFRFNEFGEFVNWKDQEAWFVSMEDALDILFRCGIDELSIALLKFQEFDYIPPLPESNTVVPCAAIYSRRIGFTTKGDDVSISLENDAWEQLRQMI